MRPTRYVTRSVFLIRAERTEMKRMSEISVRCPPESCCNVFVFADGSEWYEKQKRTPFVRSSSTAGSSHICYNRLILKTVRSKGGTMCGRSSAERFLIELQIFSNVSRCFRAAFKAQTHPRHRAKWIPTDCSCASPSRSSTDRSFCHSCTF